VVFGGLASDPGGASFFTGPVVMLGQIGSQAKPVVGLDLPVGDDGRVDEMQHDIGPHVSGIGEEEVVDKSVEVGGRDLPLDDVA
jgi:hypothetical protein